MNILQVLSAIEERDPEIFERLSTRRRAMRSFAGIGKKLSLTALPLALGAVFQKAYGQTPNSTVIDVLNFALTLEYLETEFYTTALAAPNLIPAGADRDAITIIKTNEMHHVAFLQTTIIQLGGTPIPKPTFDLTGGNGSGNGPFAPALTDYDFFLGAAQTFEDTGGRAYRGQAGNLQGAPDVLEGSLRIHSVETRHASKLRQMRRLRGATNVKPWVTGADPGLGANNALAADNYAGEDNTVQLGINIVNINGQPISAAAASESFDEPLTRAQVEAIVDKFIV